MPAHLSWSTCVGAVIVVLPLIHPQIDGIPGREVSAVFSQILTVRAPRVRQITVFYPVIGVVTCIASHRVVPSYRANTELVHEQRCERRDNLRVSFELEMARGLLRERSYMMLRRT